MKRIVLCTIFLLVFWNILLAAPPQNTTGFFSRDPLNRYGSDVNFFAFEISENVFMNNRWVKLYRYRSHAQYYNTDGSLKEYVRYYPDGEILERSVYNYEYSDNGKIAKITEANFNEDRPAGKNENLYDEQLKILKSIFYNSEGNMAGEIEYENGKPKGIEEIPSLAYIQTRDNNTVTVEFTDKASHYINGELYSKSETHRDERGFPISISYFNRDGELITRSERFYNDKGQLVMNSYFSPEDRLISRDVSARNDYDDVTMITYFEYDEKGNFGPVNINYFVYEYYSK